MELIDLSHTIHHELVTYPGLPGPQICDFLSRSDSAQHYADGATFQIGRIDMVANTGTYVDAPFHRFADGADLAALPLERLAHLDTVVVDCGEGREIGPELLTDFDVSGRAVLFRTGWSRHFATAQYAQGHPYLAPETAHELVRRGAALVGIDSLNIDEIGPNARPVHTALLSAGIPIAEHLTQLERLPQTGLRFHAVPVKVRALGTFPVRAYAVVDGGG